MVDVYFPQQMARSGGCDICLEERPRRELQHVGCAHQQCNNCIQRNARQALESSPFRPAKCCQIFSMDIIRTYGGFTEGEVASYADRLEEVTNPRGSLYCYRCGTYIPFANRRPRIGVCTKCKKRTHTCKKCLAKSHRGACDQERLREARVAENHLLRKAEKEGWKSCPTCLHMVAKSKFSRISLSPFLMTFHIREVACDFSLRKYIP